MEQSQEEQARKIYAKIYEANQHLSDLCAEFKELDTGLKNVDLKHIIQAATESGNYFYFVSKAQMLEMAEFAKAPTHIDAKLLKAFSSNRPTEVLSDDTMKVERIEDKIRAVVTQEINKLKLERMTFEQMADNVFVTVKHKLVIKGRPFCIPTVWRALDGTFVIDGLETNHYVLIHNDLLDNCPEWRTFATPYQLEFVENDGDCAVYFVTKEGE